MVYYRISVSAKGLWNADVCLDPVRFLFEPKPDFLCIQMKVNMEVLEILRFCVEQGQMAVFWSVKAV